MKNKKEIRELCHIWISRHDNLKSSVANNSYLKAVGVKSQAIIRRDEERLVEASRDLRDAITEAGI